MAKRVRPSKRKKVSFPKNKNGLYSYRVYTPDGNGKGTTIYKSKNVYLNKKDAQKASEVWGV